MSTPIFGEETDSAIGDSKHAQSESLVDSETAVEPIEALSTEEPIANEDSVRPDAETNHEQLEDANTSSRKPILSIFQMRMIAMLNSPRDVANARIKRVAAIGLISAASYAVFEPLVQPWLITIFRYSPALAAGAAGVALLAYLIRKNQSENGGKSLKIGGASAACFLLCLLFIYSNSAAWVVETQMSAAMKPESLVELPHSNNLRMLPRITGLEYLRNSSSNTATGIGSPAEPGLSLDCNDEGTCSLWWQSPMTYKHGLGNLPAIWFKSVNRVTRVNASDKDMLADKVSGKDAKFWFGGQSFVTEILFRWSHPFSQRGELAYYQKKDGEWVMLLSYVSLRPTLTGTMIPTLGGVMEFNHYGFATNHSVKSAAKLFPGTVLFPTKLGRAYAEAHAHWHSGLLNVLVHHFGIDELSEDITDRSQNRMPYLQVLDGMGLVQVVTTEPLGNQNFALSEILFFDAVTGKSFVWQPGELLSLNGPRRAALNTVGSDPEINWKNYDGIEPLIAVDSEGRLSYRFAIVRDDGNNHTIANFVLVDASSLKAQTFKTRAELEAILQNRQAPAVSSSSDAAPAMQVLQ